MAAKSGQEHNGARRGRAGQSWSISAPLGQKPAQGHLEAALEVVLFVLAERELEMKKDAEIF